MLQTGFQAFNKMAGIQTQQATSSRYVSSGEIDLSFHFGFPFLTSRICLFCTMYPYFGRAVNEPHRYRWGWFNRCHWQPLAVVPGPGTDAPFGGASGAGLPAQVQDIDPVLLS